MIKKIIRINNVGKFTNYNSRGYSNCDFKKNTIIYAENGCGKTTLSVALKSLTGRNSLIKKKQSFGTDSGQIFEILSESGVLKYENSKWNVFNKKIEIFDVHFIEDNIYTGSALPDASRTNLFEVVVGEKGIKLKTQIFNLIEEQRNYTSQRRTIKNKLKFEKNQLSKTEIDGLNLQHGFLNEKIATLGQPIIEKSRELGKYSQKVFGKHVEEINNQLKFFTPYIEIKKFSNKSKGGVQFLSYFLTVSGHNIAFERDTKVGPTVKYSLSEGDKSAIALAFFLAKVNMTSKLEERIIVFDDPISSFDHSRRSSTINQLIKLSEKAKQLIVLTHDIYFARDIKNRLKQAETKSLKIINSPASSLIREHDIDAETLSGIFKDISVLKNYIDNGVSSELEKREVIRCIRPIIEGVIRIKFFTDVLPSEWLGDVIGKTRNSVESEPLSRLKPILNDLIEINDYSKSFHHSDPTNPWGDIINDEELRIYVSRTLELIIKI
ncbi:MAG: AAA family ATPase [Bacteroidales bacterium]|nr:AAA family ATPase [Bacteroidales bacterium]